MDATESLRLIEGAFPLQPRPPMSLHAAHLADDTMTRDISESEWAEAEEIDKNRTWRDYSDQELLACDYALAHLDAASFVYYLPAYMAFAVRNFSASLLEPAGRLCNSAIFALTSLSAYNLSRLKCLSSDQRRAVIAFLEAFAGSAHRCAGDARVSLQQYWKADESSKPLIIVP